MIRRSTPNGTGATEGGFVGRGRRRSRGYAKEPSQAHYRHAHEDALFCGERES